MLEVSSCSLILRVKSNKKSCFHALEIDNVEHLVFSEQCGLVPSSWACKKHMALAQSSTETEVVSLDIGLRMEGSLASKVVGYCE